MRDGIKRHGCLQEMISHSMVQYLENSVRSDITVDKRQFVGLSNFYSK